MTVQPRGDALCPSLVDTVPRFAIDSESKEHELSSGRVEDTKLNVSPPTQQDILLCRIRLRRIDAHSPDVSGEVVRLACAIHIFGLGANVAQRVGQVVLASHRDQLAIDTAPVVDVKVRHCRVDSAIISDREA